MTDAVKARWHGDDYQARIFWLNALNLFDGATCVVEVTFEADGPKSFDDVVVKYSPPIPGAGPLRVPAEYHQVKWHVQRGGRFGYADLCEPAFIGAKTTSLLERLRDAKRTAPPGARFSFVTVDRVSDGDPLAELISGSDRSLLVEKLFDGTTDASRMGKVRRAWREHLGLPDDDSLRGVVEGLRIFEAHHSLDELRSTINWRAKVVGLLAFDATSDFRYDALARALKSRQLNALTRATLEAFCKEEGVWVGSTTEAPDVLPVAVRSFEGTASDVSGAAHDNTLLLTADFRQRYLRDDRDWQRDIRPKVTAFLAEMAKKSNRLRLILDAHASIAFLAGSVLHLKSGVSVELVQKGRAGPRVWRADDATEKGAPQFVMSASKAGTGTEIVVAISIARDVEPDARGYVASRVANVGDLLSFSLPGGPGQQGVLGGAHAAALADQIANMVRSRKGQNVDAVVHLFAAVPNSVLYFLGQQHQSIAPCVIYEYDFDRAGNKTYHPSFVMS